MPAIRRWPERRFRRSPISGLLLPCNVVIFTTEPPDGTVVAAMDPESALALTGNDAMRPIAAQVAAKLRRVIERTALVSEARHVESVESKG